MKLHPTPLKDSCVIEPEKKGDDRGFFSRMFCIKELKKLGLDINIAQVNNSRSEKKGTLRGMHYQLSPKQEIKIVRCIEGAIYDVILDLRPNSETFGKSYGKILDQNNRLMMIVPKGFAHGFLTLTDASEIIYLVSEYYTPELERGIRWNDPTFNIQWPDEPTTISLRDQSHPNFCKEHHL